MDEAAFPLQIGGYRPYKALYWDCNEEAERMAPYLVIAAVLGFLPAISYVLVCVEAWMIFQIAHGYHVDNTGEIVFFCLKAGALSAVLKTVAHALHMAPLIGQIANSLVALLFILGLYAIADAHYAHLAAIGVHPDTVLNQ